MTAFYSIVLSTSSSALTISAGYRTSTINFRTTDDKPSKYPNHLVHIPSVNITVEPEVLSSALMKAYEKLQDAIIKDKVIEYLSVSSSRSNAVGLNITDEDISAAACAAYSSSSSSLVGKPSASKIELWFKQCLEDNLTLAFANALNLSDNPEPAQLSKVSAIVAEHRHLLTKLAGPTYRISDERTINRLIKAVNLATSETAHSRDHKQWATDKLSKMLKPVTTETLAFDLPDIG